MPLQLLGLGHVGIRVADRDRAVAFYRILGFDEVAWHAGPRVSILRNPAGLEINLIVNANDANEGKNVLMDVTPKYAGYTHAAFAVASIEDTLAMLEREGVAVSEGPVTLGDGYVAIFVRDPDRNVVELGKKAHA